MTAVGSHVARSRDGVVHIARVVQRDGLVLALCGNTLLRPRTTRMTGLDCAVCAALAKEGAK